LDVKAIRSPSGDHAGWASSAGSDVSWIGSLPSNEMIQMSGLPEREEVIAILAPSGDHAGGPVAPKSVN
jgi:hypothetical protein